MPTKQTHQYLKRELAKIKDSFLHTLIDTAQYGFSLITPDFLVLEINDKMLEWFPEVKAGDGSLCYQCFYAPESEAPCPGCPAELSRCDGKVHSAVIEKRALDNHPQYFKITCTPVMDKNSLFLGVIEIAENITEKVGMEDKIHSLESRYYQLIDTASDAIISCNAAGTITLFNKKARELFGYDADEIIGKKFYALTPAETREEQQTRFEQLVSETESSVPDKIVAGVCLKKDGAALPSEITYATHKNIHGVTITAIIRDITERKAAEDKLQQYTLQLEQEVTDRTRDFHYSQERLHLFLQTANDAIVSTDQDGVIIYINKRAEEIFGYEREELLGKNISLLTPKEIWQLAQFGSHSQGSQIADHFGKTLESWAVKKDHATFPIEFTLSSFERDNERFFTSIIRDISRRKKLEQKLQEYTTTLEDKVKERTFEFTQSQQRLNEKVAELSILTEIGEVLASTMDLESVLDIILVGATSHHGLGFNRAFLFLLNENNSYLEGTVAVGPANAEEAHRVWSEILGRQMSLKEMLNSYTKNQSTVDTYVNELVKSIRIPVQGEENVLTHVLTTKKPLNIVNAASHPLVPPQLIATMHCTAFTVVPLIAREKVLGVLWADNAITQKPIEERDVERMRIFSNNASLAIENSNLYRSIQDKVDELNRAYQELQENKDRLVRSEKLAAVGEMSAMVAHAIRNPLTAIGGFARRLQKREAANATTYKYLKIMVEEIDRLEVLLTEILEFVRPRELNIKSRCINELLANTYEILTEEFRLRDIVVLNEYAPDLPLVSIDGDQFKEVFLNMFRNSMDAMPEGGTITVSTQVEDQWVKITIADTGMGIAQSDTEKIFNPFFTRKSRGSGLGLAVCNQIVSGHGGYINLRSEVLAGAIFDIYLPAS
jgi:PAS domain S-box-containing protein